jgi:hypothetical protein
VGGWPKLSTTTALGVVVLEGLGPGNGGSVTTYDEVLKVVYTPERALWLDPEDADEIVRDVLSHLDKIGHLRRPAFTKSVGTSTVALDSEDELARTLAKEDGKVWWTEHIPSVYRDSARAMLDDCTNDTDCEAEIHLMSCPVGVVAKHSVPRGGLAGGSCRSPEL